MKKIGFIAFALYMSLSIVSYAQVMEDDEEGSLDGFYVKESEMYENGKKPFEYPYIREADVIWAHRVWRVIDFREKMNQVFYYPVTPDQGRKNLYTILDEALLEGRIRAFDNDMFENEINWAEQKASLIPPRQETLIVYDQDGMEQEKDTTIYLSLAPEDVKQLRIKEDWFLDKNRTVEDVRIIGFALIYYLDKGDGSTPMPMPLCWIRYNDPEVRELLANSEVYNFKNDRMRPSYDDVFRKRIFSSYVIRETTVFGRRIEEYAAGADALAESARIEDYLFNMEEDMWEY
ncbi:MAG TPA: gliding motility protein GldN [Candidatus Onthomorpha intestinigallinarum]|uniref:Gliding motility protein GldN n=1 Tax=Candidatus Onthomorpha intestinigallinarum TaxID=2840880 RepID=A0A9D1RGA8_9BACT|nr:gliding motility protein GldN [Candidatus Onthomorpha intestinigallinarum]